MTSGKITHFVWTDMGAEDEAAFNEWYANEHMPDRVHRIPGFTRGRRFVALSGAPKYLAYYEMANRDVFWTKEYVALRGEPDPKSRYFVARFKNTHRSTANIAAEKDGGEGRFLAIAGITMQEHKGQQPFRSSLLDAAVGEGVSRARLSRADDELVQGNFKKMEEGTRGSLRPRDRVSEWIITVEGSDRASVSAALKTLVAACGPRATTDATAVMELLSDYWPPAT